MKPEGHGDAMWSNLQRSIEHAEAEPIHVPEAVNTERESGEHTPSNPPRHEDVKQRVRELIGKYPTVRSQQLYDLAVRMHPELEEGGLRRFHARYVLPIKREVARAEGRIAPRARKPEPPPRRTRRRTGAGPEQHTTDSAGVVPAPSVQDVIATRTRVRTVLMKFSRDLVNADSRADLVDVLARMEDVVDEVIGAANISAADAHES